MSIESEIKQQFAKFFQEKDWHIFKSVGEYYLSSATRLRKKDINTEKHQLLIRNAQKRLFIGIGCELLVKAFLLKEGYGINKLEQKKKKELSLSEPYKIKEVSPNWIIKTEAYSFNQILDRIGKIPTFKALTSHERRKVMDGFKIAKVFRNKEAHVTTPRHRYNPQNYRDIEQALVIFYKIAFEQRLAIKFSIGVNEDGFFEIFPLEKTKS